LSPRLALRCCCASVLLFASTPAFPQHSTNSAQKDYALIYGTVWGPDDRPVPGVPVSIRRSGDRKPKWQLTSDNRGEFAQRVPAGEDDYIVQAEIKTPKGEPKPQATVHVAGDERQDIGLHLTQEQLSHKR
jgi:hypothetical protein